MTETEALLWTTRIISIAVLFQTLELLQLRETWAANGIWRWAIVRKEFSVFPSFIRRALDFLLGDSGFLGVLWFRLGCAIGFLSLPHIALSAQAVLSLGLLLTTILVCLRWRGTFNGGSDFMTLVVLSALCAATLFGKHPEARAGALWYIAIQACTSYFIAGVIKLKRRNWLTGRALSGFLQSTIYAESPALRLISDRPILALAASWCALAFECTFPLALLSPELCLAYIALALLFHLANFHVFGLNRFLYAWASAYPALYYCSQLRS